MAAEQEITFRGVRVDNHELVFGSLVKLKRKTGYEFFIVTEDEIWHWVEADSIGWNGGPTDRHAESIYTGDILRIAKAQVVVVGWNSMTGSFESNPSISYAEWGWDETMTDKTKFVEIIGNIHQNPGLVP